MAYALYGNGKLFGAVMQNENEGIIWYFPLTILSKSLTVSTGLAVTMELMGVQSKQERAYYLFYIQYVPSLSSDSY